MASSSFAGGTPSAAHPALEFYRRHRVLVWSAAAAAAGLYAAYRAAPAADGERPTPSGPLQRLRATLANYASTATCLGEAAALVSSDLRAFLASDADDVPRSLRQLNKLLQAPELHETLSTSVASVVRGVERSGVLQPSMAATSGSSASLVDTMLEALLSERGRGLVGVAVGVATRNATSALCEFYERRMAEEAAASGAASAGGVGLNSVLDLLGTEQGERLMSLLITKSIRTAVSTYVESTAGYNVYNDVLASITKQDQRDAVTDVMTRITAAFCRELAAAYRRASSSAPNGRPAANAQQQQHAGGAAAASSAADLASSSLALAALAAVGGTGGSSGAASPAYSSAGSSTCSSSLYNGKDAATSSACSSVAAALEVSSGGGAEVAISNLKIAHGRCGAAAGGPRGAGGSGGGGLNSGPPARALLAGQQAQQARQVAPAFPPAWLRQVVELAKERDVRSLAVDVVGSASREATRGAVEGFLYGGSGDDAAAGASGSRSGGDALSRLGLPPMAGYRLYVVASLAVSLLTYALSPHALVL